MLTRKEFITLASKIDLKKEELEKIMEYPNELIVYPGHGDSTILGKEKEKFSRYF